MIVDARMTEVSELETSGESRWRVLRLLLRKRIALICIGVLLVFYVAGFFAPLVAPHDPNRQELTVEARLQSPSSQNLLGTDRLGRDLLSRVIYASRTTILFTIAVIVTGGLILGLGLGLLSGYRGGWVDNLIMRVGELLGGIPTLFLMLVIAAAYRQRINDLAFWMKDNTFLGDDARPLLYFLIIVGVAVPFAWVGSARIVRSQVLAIREQEYVLAAEALGVSTVRLLFRHILPGVLPVYIVGLSASMAGIAGAELALSWLGLGVDPTTPSFGTMIFEAGGVRTFQEYPHLLLVGAIPIILFLFAWNLLGDAMVDLVEPRTFRR
ncbi:MAG: peptide ABC transporter permease [Dehalococcoidia bacterium]|nr:peptide ABC transporter permease [Dehalococcoidia bacterium]|tara:strand:+ start:21268 stop:22242 length:975 start_codon:yes stop_codon:yes gene_type:complete